MFLGGNNSYLPLGRPKSFMPNVRAGSFSLTLAFLKEYSCFLRWKLSPTQFLRHYFFLFPFQSPFHTYSLIPQLSPHLSSNCLHHASELPGTMLSLYLSYFSVVLVLHRGLPLPTLIRMLISELQGPCSPSAPIPICYDPFLTHRSLYL